jgi:hypothetical protein
MNKELQIKSLLLDIEAKLDKNSNPYFRLSLSEETFTTLTNTPHNLVNHQVLITYQELPNQNNNGTFCQVKAIELV